MPDGRSSTPSSLSPGRSGAGEVCHAVEYAMAEAACLLLNSDKQCQDTSLKLWHRSRPHQLVVQSAAEGFEVLYRRLWSHNKDRHQKSKAIRVRGRSGRVALGRSVADAFPPPEMELGNERDRVKAQLDAAKDKYFEL